MIVAKSSIPAETCMTAIYQHSCCSFRLDFCNTCWLHPRELPINDKEVKARYGVTKMEDDACNINDTLAGTKQLDFWLSWMLTEAQPTCDAISSLLLNKILMQLMINIRKYYAKILFVVSLGVFFATSVSCITLESSVIGRDAKVDCWATKTVDDVSNTEDTETNTRASY